MRRELFNKKSVEIIYNGLCLGYYGSLEEHLSYMILRTAKDNRFQVWGPDGELYLRCVWKKNIALSYRPFRSIGGHHLQPALCGELDFPARDHG